MQAWRRDLPRLRKAHRHSQRRQLDGQLADDPAAEAIVGPHVVIGKLSRSNVAVAITRLDSTLSTDVVVVSADSDQDHPARDSSGLRCPPSRDGGGATWAGLSVRHDSRAFGEQVSLFNRINVEVESCGGESPVVDDPSMVAASRTTPSSQLQSSARGAARRPKQSRGRGQRRGGSRPRPTTAFSRRQHSRHIGQEWHWAWEVLNSRPSRRAWRDLDMIVFADLAQDASRHAGGNNACGKVP